MLHIIFAYLLSKTGYFKDANDYYILSGWGSRLRIVLAKFDSRMPHSQVSVYSLGSTTSCCREHRIFARHGESFVRILPAGRIRLVVDDLDGLLQ